MTPQTPPSARRTRLLCCAVVAWLAVPSSGRAATDPSPTSSLRVSGVKRVGCGLARLAIEYRRSVFAARTMWISAGKGYRPLRLQGKRGTVTIDLPIDPRARPGDRLTLHARSGGKNPPLGQPRLLDINRATAKQLQQIEGIGPALASRIVDRRDAIAQKGGYGSLFALLDVEGIGVKRLQAMVPSLTEQPLPDVGIATP